jgi:SNF2 family DNA or RNA helicase
MGQTLPVQTIRFIVEDSIEESMVETQEKKKRLVSMTFKGEKEEGSGGQEERLRNMTQLMFGSKGYRRNRVASN